MSETMPNHAVDQGHITNTAESGNIEEAAWGILHAVYGPNATFRDGQLEAVKAVFENRRILLVQKTGWGKSLVYFLATRMMREQGRGFILIISPLLELMKNQREAASKFKLSCEELNSTVDDANERRRILNDVAGGKVDVLFTTPETLFKDEVQARIPEMDIALFVIDEAHCLSDWGHDFRREYGHLYKVIKLLPSTTPVLCTTATANDRVISDLAEHLGDDVHVSRGDLTRESLCLQVVHLTGRAERYAWIADHISELLGTGIIYCLTRRDCTYLCEFLSSEGIAVDTYFSDNLRNSRGLNSAAMEKFERNELKALIATVKLGMGYDKPDVGFVIHFQRPQNIVSYYQQIGRAGRDIPKAYAILMSGPEDNKIAESFIKNAFPTEELCRSVLQVVKAQGKKKTEIIANVNDRKARIEKAIDFLEFDGYLRKDGAYYYVTPKPFQYNREHYEAITQVRRHELSQMQALAGSCDCLLETVTRCLNDPQPHACGHCANCVGEPLIPETCLPDTLARAQKCIDKRVVKILPRKLWANTGDSGPMGKITHPLHEGVCLSKYGDAGYGAMVQEDKYKNECYRDELLQRAVEVLRGEVRRCDLRAVTIVPSLRNTKVNDFAKRLATCLGLDYVELLDKTAARQQKEMENSAYQCRNAWGSFSLKPETVLSTNLILVDDIVDSRWTLTVCGELLGEAGCPLVFPFALADSSEERSNLE